MNIQKIHAETEATDTIRREMMGHIRARMGVYGRRIVNRVRKSDRSSDILMLFTSGRYWETPPVTAKKMSVIVSILLKMNSCRSQYCISLIYFGLVWFIE